MQYDCLHMVLSLKKDLSKCPNSISCPFRLATRKMLCLALNLLSTERNSRKN